jgi:putative transposase
LRREGYVVGRKRIRRLMQKMGLSVVYQRPRATVPDTRSIRTYCATS